LSPRGFPPRAQGRPGARGQRDGDRRAGRGWPGRLGRRAARDLVRGRRVVSGADHRLRGLRIRRIVVRVPARPPSRAGTRTAINHSGKGLQGDDQMTAMHTETVAVLGAGGTMGFPIARNIARAGMPLRAWNRSRAKVGPLTEDGAYIADTPADAADGVSGSMGGADGALRVMPGANHENEHRTDDPNGPHHAIWLQISTIGEAATKRCAELANRAGVGFV